MPEKLGKQLTDEQKNRLFFVAGQTNPQLAIDTAEYLGVPVRPIEAKKFPSGEIYARHLESVRGRDVYVLQSHVETPELSIDGAIRQQRELVVAARDADARSVRVVVPYLGYSRQDRKSKPREANAAAQVVRDFQNDGARAVISFNLHSGQSQGFFEGPYDHMTSLPVLSRKMEEIMGSRSRDGFIAIGPDQGATKMIERVAGPLGIDVGYVNKRRTADGKVESSKVVGEVAGRICFMIDDMIDTGGTHVSAAEEVKNMDATDILLFATHGIFSADAAKKLDDSPISEIYVTDTLPQEKNLETIRNLGVLTIAPLLGATIFEIHTDGSVSRVFGSQNQH